MRDVLRLDDYRGRRMQRFRRTTALYQADPERAKLVRCLGDACDLLGADRAAILWVDEYGAGLVHVHTLLDLGSDEPRRGFSITPLRKAWEEGVPGLLDFPDMGKAGGVILPEGPRSFCTVALGSDGSRSWFLVADSITPRPPLGRGRAESLMFLAGECASILLHLDLEDDAREAEASSFDRVRRERFSGWPVLQDVERGTADEALDRRVTCRFLVTRLVCTLVDDDFSTDPESLRHQIEGVRKQMGHEAVGAGPERRSWVRVVDAVESGDRRNLAAAILELSDRIEWQGHLHGARELHRLAYDVAVSIGNAALAVDAARFVGRACRRLSDWEDAFHWYGVARTVAAEAGLREQEAIVIDGLGNTVRDRGNLPRARELYEEVLEIGRELASREVQAKAHQNLAVVEKHAGRTDEAIRHGWAAVNTYDASEWKTRALADLADVFLRSGELGAAEDAYAVVARTTGQIDTRVVALDALAHIAALRGDRAGFQRKLADARGIDLDSVNVTIRAEILFYRAKSYLAVGDEEEARRLLRRTVSLSERCGINRILLWSEALLQRLTEEADTAVPDPGEESGAASGWQLPAASVDVVADVREPLTRLKNEVVAV